MEKFATYDKFGMKEYKETFIVGSGNLSSSLVALREVGRERLEIAHSRCREDGHLVFTCL